MRVARLFSNALIILVAQIMKTFITHPVVCSLQTMLTKEKIVLKPTPGSKDQCSVCDPGVIYFNDYYYLYVSECAKQVASVTSCADLVESAFGGLDRIIAQQEVLTEYGTYNYTSPSGEVDKDAFAYGWTKTDAIGDGADIWTSSSDYKFQNRRLRPTGVATEVYNNIIDTLSTQCMNLQGKFIESQFVDHNRYGADENTSICNLTLTHEVPGYGINTGYQENMCPKDYMLTVDTVAWGICSCWENGGRRSKNGLFGKCTNVIPVTNENTNDNACGNSLAIANNGNTTIDKWCSSIINIDTNQVCPFGDQSSQCVIPDNDGNSLVPSGI